MTDVGTDLEPIGPKPSVAMMRVSGIEVPVIVAPRCRTCHSPVRIPVEEALLSGLASTKAIAEHHGLSRHSVGRHSKRHVSLKQRARMLINDEHARAAGIDPESTDGVVYSIRGFLNSIVFESLQDLMNNRVRPTLADGLRASQLLINMEALAGGGIDEIQTAIAFAQHARAYSEAVSMLAPDLVEPFRQLAAQNLQGNPVALGYVQRGVIEVNSHSDSDPVPAERESTMSIRQTSDSAPAVDSARATSYLVDHATDSAPVSGDFASAIVIHQETEDE